MELPLQPTKDVPLQSPNSPESSPATAQDSAQVQEPWNVPQSRVENLKGSQGGKNYSHTGGVNSSFENHLFGAVDPSGSYRHRVILHEKPVHRLMQTMFAKGYTIEEIALQTGYTRVRVAQVLRQPWAQMNIVDDVKRSVQDEIKELLEGEVLPTIRKITALQDDPQAPHAVRLAASREILDRFLGRPNQPITQSTAEPSQLTTKELESRVAQIVGRVATKTDNSS